MELLTRALEHSGCLTGSRTPAAAEALTEVVETHVVHRASATGPLTSNLS